MAIFSAGASGISTASSFNFSEENHLQEQVHSGSGILGSKLAIVKIEGVITGQSNSYQKSMADVAIEQINAATEDASINGLLLHLNTPGGEVTASDKIYHAAKKFSETDRPIVAYMDTVAASGGYYIACAADEIVATETTITGSIGVIMGGLNGTQLMEKVGLKSQTFTSGAFKDTMSISREMRDDERAYIQGLIDSTYGKFAGIVSEARNIPLEKLKNGIADGRIFHGSGAAKVGLVDQTGYIEDAIEALKLRAGVTEAKIIYYRLEPGLGDVLSLFGVKAASNTEIKIDWGQGQFTSDLKPFVPYMVLPGY